MEVRSMETINLDHLYVLPSLFSHYTAIEHCVSFMGMSKTSILFSLKEKVWKPSPLKPLFPNVAWLLIRLEWLFVDGSSWKRFQQMKMDLLFYCCPLQLITLTVNKVFLASRREISEVHPARLSAAIYSKARCMKL